jgi:p-hydroxybenzoate 3-monooxygenase
MERYRVQVGIVGAGPAGLLLGQLLAVRGIRTIVLERQSRAYVEARIRAGVLEQGTVELLRRAGVAERLEREGLVHAGIEIAVDAKRHRIDFLALTGGKTVTVYGQTQVTKDLVAARLAAGEPLVFEAEDVTPLGIESDAPRLRFVHEGMTHEVRCDFIAGCDGFHGVCRSCIPAGVLRTLERTYPFAWLGILAESPPPSDELIYSRHPRGFSLCSMRSRTLSRHYLQCDPDEDLAGWPDERVWEELGRRLTNPEGNPVRPGRVLDKSVTTMRSFMVEPMQHGRLFLAGDAAHIVPPTGAKGLNLAASDVHYLHEGLVEHFERGSDRGLERYSERAAARVWKAQRFSWWMTSMLHNFPDTGAGSGFDERVRRAELEYTLSSRAARAALAENYVGLPF